MLSHYAKCCECGEPIYDDGHTSLCQDCDPCPYDRSTPPARRQREQQQEREAYA